MKESKYSKSENKKTINMIKHISVFSKFKPFYFPPPDLGVVESMGSYENSSKFFKSVRSSNVNQSYWNKNNIDSKLRSPQKKLKVTKTIEIWDTNQASNEKRINTESLGQAIQSEDREVEVISIGSLNSEDSKLEYSEPTSWSNEDANQNKIRQVNTSHNDDQNRDLDELSNESYYLLEGK